MLCTAIPLCGQGMEEIREVRYFNDTFPYFRKIRQSRSFEVETLKPVFEYVQDSSATGVKKTLYYYLDCIPHKVSSAVSYKGGFKRLRQYTDSLCWQHYDTHVNQRALYTMLFDKQLKIIEVKILVRRSYDNARYGYDDLIKKILFSTEGSWEILPGSYRMETDSIGSEYYFTLGIFHLP